MKPKSNFDLQKSHFLPVHHRHQTALDWIVRWLGGRILGYREDALKILKCMDFYISSSLSEGLPISMLEAFASRIPTIATEITGNKDILPNSVFGVLTEAASPKSIAKGIVEMTQLTRKERGILTRNALNRIKTHFTIEQMANETTLVYNSVLGKNI